MDLLQEGMEIDEHVDAGEEQQLHNANMEMSQTSLNASHADNDQLKSDMAIQSENFRKLELAKKDVEKENARLTKDKEQLATEKNVLLKEKASILVEMEKDKLQIIGKTQEFTNEIEKKNEEIANMKKDHKSTQDRLEHQCGEHERNIKSIAEKYVNETGQLNQQIKQLQLENKSLDEEVKSLHYYCVCLQNQVAQITRDFDISEANRKDLLLRISKVASASLVFNNPNIADLSDGNRPTKLSEKFSELYDNQWTDAFEALEGNEKQKTRILLAILKSVDDCCSKLVNRHKENIEASFMSIDVAHPFCFVQDSEFQNALELTCEGTQNGIKTNILDNHKSGSKSQADNSNTGTADNKKVAETCMVNNLPDDTKNYINGKTLDTNRGKNAGHKCQENNNMDESVNPSQDTEHGMKEKKEEEEQANAHEPNHDSELNHESQITEDVEQSLNEPNTFMNHSNDDNTIADSTSELSIETNNSISNKDNVQCSSHGVLTGKDIALNQKETINGLSSHAAPESFDTKNMKAGTTLSTTSETDQDAHADNTCRKIHDGNDDSSDRENRDTKLLKPGGETETNTTYGTAIMNNTDSKSKEPSNKDNNDLKEPEKQEISRTVQGQNFAELHPEETLHSSMQPINKNNNDKNELRTSMEHTNNEHDKTTNGNGQLELSTDRESTSKLEQKHLDKLEKSKPLPVNFETKDKTDITVINSLDRITTDKKFDEFSDEQKKTVQDMTKRAEFLFTSDAVALITKLVASGDRIWQHEKVRKYIEECAKIVWCMQLHHPPVHIYFESETNQLFNSEVYRAYTKTGKILDYVVWPPLYLYKDGPMLSKGVAQGK